MSTSPPPVVADRYRLVAPLGQGGMGRVWRATDVVLHRDVAIKELVPPPGLTTEERQEMRERSLREARAIARLNHVNVVRIFDVLRTDADPWIVMEYVPSRSLQDILAADGPYPPARAAEIGLGVLGALRAAHRAGVVHRDVKPGNVLIGEDGRVVLTDFGLATVPGDPNVTRTGLVLGSPAYIAPERARDGSAGPGADLWSLGATLYAAVEGASPFARPSAIATLAALATENPPPARNAGPLKSVLNGLLRKDPAQRINAEEAERLLLRASGRRSRISFPMNPTMRRPGLGRERPSAPPVVPGTSVLPSTSVVPGTPVTPAPAAASAAASGPATASGSAPVVPGPRPPVSPAQPGAAQPGPGRPVFAPGKATVGRPAAVAPVRPVAAAKLAADAPTRIDAAPVGASPNSAVPLDVTRVDTPAVDATQTGKVDAPRVDKDATQADEDATRVDKPALDVTRVDAPAVPDADSWTRGRARPVPVATPQGQPKPSSRTATPSRPDAPESAPSKTARSSAVVVPAGDVPRTEAVEARAVEQSESQAVGRVEAETAERMDDAPASPAPHHELSPTAPEPVAAEQDALKQAVSEWVASEQAVSERVASEQPDSKQPDSKQPDPKQADSAPATSEQVAPERTLPEQADPHRDAAALTSTGVDSAAPEGVGGSATPTGVGASGGSAASAGTVKDAPVEGAAVSTPAAAVNPRPIRNKVKGKASRAKGGKTPGRAGRDVPAATDVRGRAGAAAPSTSVTEATPTAAVTDEATGEPTIVEAASTPPGRLRAADTPTVSGRIPSDEQAVSGRIPSDEQAVSGRIPSDERAVSGRTPTGEMPAATAAMGAGATSTQVEEPSAEWRAPGMRTPSTSGAVPLSGAPVGSSRPPWRPMPVRAPSSGRAGLTIFGVTLDRRQTFILVGVVVVVLVALLLTVPKAFGDEQAGDVGGPGGGGPATSAAPTAASSQAVPAAPVPAPSTPASPAPSTPASTAPPTATRTPSAAVTPSKAPATGAALPVGWRLHRDGTGYSVPVPQDWSMQRDGTETYFRENSGDRRVLIIDQTRTPNGDPAADWADKERSRRGTYRDYRQVRIIPVSYRGWDAADWEFTYTSRSGNPLHSVKRGFVTAPDQAYGISWITPAGQWGKNLDDLQVILDGFQPARS